MNSLLDPTPIPQQTPDLNGADPDHLARPPIDVGIPLHQKADLGIEALVAANDERLPTVMVMGTELVRMTERGELEPLNRESLRDQLSRVAQFQKFGRDGEPHPVDPPSDVANVILARDPSEYVDLPRVEWVTDVPVLGAAGTLVTEPGYDAASKLYYQPAAGLEGVKPRSVEMTDDLDWALNLIDEELFGDFGFVDDADRAHAYSILLSPFLRPAFDSKPTPMHAVLAPDVGSGKTWLAQAALLPGCGLVPATPPTSSDEEMRKRITSSLLAGKPAVLLDNLSGKVDSGSLAAALTTDVWVDRILGESRNVTLPIRNMWVLTGNNLRFSPEQVRRAVPVYLDPGDVKPSDRARGKFRHPDLLGWATEHRRILVEAALTIIQHWLDGPVEVEGGYVLHRVGDERRDGQRTKGSYERWAAVVGGVLDACGISGFLGNEDKLKAEADDETRESREFLAALHSAADGPLQVKEIAQMCEYGGPLADVVPDGPASAPPGKLNRALTTWLTEHRGRLIGGFKLQSRELGGKGNPLGWYVQDRAQRG